MYPTATSRTGNDRKRKSKCKKQKKNKSKSFWVQATALAFVAILTVSVKISGAASKSQRRQTIAAVHPRHSVQFPEAPGLKVTMRELRPYSGKGHLSWRDLYHSVHQGKTRQQQQTNTKTSDHKMKKRSLQDEESDSDVQGGSDLSEKEVDQGLDELRLTVHDHHAQRTEYDEPHAFYMERHDHHPVQTRLEPQQDADSADYFNYQRLGNYENFEDLSANSKPIERIRALQSRDENNVWPDTVNGKAESPRFVESIHDPEYMATRWNPVDSRQYDEAVGADHANMELSPDLRNELDSGVFEYGIARERQQTFPGEHFRESNSRSMSSANVPRRRNKWLLSKRRKLGLPRGTAHRRLWRKKTVPDDWNDDFYHQLYDATVEKTVEDDKNVHLVVLGQQTEMLCVPKNKGSQPKNLMVTWHNGRGAAIVVTGRYKISNVGSMQIQRVKLHDSGLHMCYVDSEDEQYKHVLAVYLPKVPGYDLRWKYRIVVCRDSDVPFLRKAFRATLLKYVCPENICDIFDVRANCQFTALGESRVLEVAAYVSGSLVDVSRCPILKCQRWKLRRSAIWGSFRLRKFARKNLSVRLPATGNQGASERTKTRRLLAIGPRSFTGIAVPSCPAGYGAGKKGKCLPCEPGRYSKAGTLHCLQCQEGFYQPEYAAESCIKCGSGTSRPGSKRKAACGLKFPKRIMRKELVITIPLTVIITFMIGALGCVGLSLSTGNGASDTEPTSLCPEEPLPFADITSTTDREDN